ncbi:unnamed protein product [Dimorphilus gyrociliatus]|uniref:Uncharacterized protein n=1 Tax=Dimorphilus gyrociliatus TaxID=2664684 RepID=A0A7I8VZD5_9ANNE|nr:unnamed protein product [Dimorphilus gyrociliatus]
MNVEVDKLKSKVFWQSVGAEAVGTFILVFVGCGSCLTNEGSPILRISLTFGLVLAAIIYAIGPVSGAHVNPTVTIGMAVCRRISIIKAVFYIVAQCLGGIVGAAILYGLTPSNLKPTLLGTTSPAPNVTDGQAFGIELFISSIFSFSVFSTTDPIHNDGSSPFVVGIVVAAIHMYAVPLTGSSLNAARSFGPALISGIWKSHWIYWFSTILGGVVGGVLYDQAFSSRSSLRRVRKTFMGTKTRREPNLDDSIDDRDIDSYDEKSFLKEKTKTERNLPTVAEVDEVDEAIEEEQLQP